MMFNITSLCSLMAVHLVLLHISLAKADAGDEFSNNFATDLAPLLALFGENVAKQFMAGSMGWTDNIIFAMAPLGIITAIVSAIRVSGRPKWLKSVIGRAREGRGNVEIELMSSTSADVCELWDGQSIVRVLGSSSVIELILGDPNSAPFGAPDPPRECYGIFSLVEAERSHIIEGTENSWRVAFSELEKSPPNMALNIFSKRRHRRELYAVAVLGTGVQVIVVALAGLETYIYPWNLSFTKDGQPVDSYAFPLMVIGTSLLVSGMIMCSHIIEASSTEVEYDLGYNFKLAWMQKGETINDQKFESFAFFSQEGHTLRKSVRDTKHDRESQVLIATVISLVGFIVQFSALRFLHWSITVCQLTAIAIMTGLRAVVRRNLAAEPKAQSMPDGFELDWMALELNACKSWKLIPLKEIPPELDSQVFGLATAVVNSRTRLRNLSNWAGRHQKTAETLTDAIEALMNLAFTNKALLREPAMWSSKDQFTWAIAAQVMRRNSNSQFESTTENVLFKLKRRRIDGSRWSLWHAESNDIQAVLGLWMLHINEVLQENRLLSREKQLQILSHMGNNQDEFDLWLSPGLNYFARPKEEALKLKKDVLLFEPVAKPNYQSEELRMIYPDASAHEICAQIIFSTFLSQVVPQWSLINDITVHYGTTRKLYSFRLLSQTVTDIVEILEKSGLATVESAYVNVISALQICQALPKSTDPAALLSLLKGVKQQEDDGLGDEADDVVLWLSHQVEMASKSYRANEAWEDAGAVYWNYYAACKEVYSSSPRTDDAARRMGRFEAIACNLRESKLLKSKKWTDVKNTSEAYKKSSQRQPQSFPPPVSANWGPIWKAIIEEDVPCLIGLLKENSTSIDGRGYNGRTPLIQASYQGFDAAVELLISKKADVGAKDDEDQTSLHHAIQNKHSGVMEILLLCDRKIQFDVDVAGRTPLSIAMVFDYTKLVKLLNFYDVDDIGRCHACRGAIERGNLGFLQQLLEKGIEPDARDESGRTPLSWAAGNGQETFIKLLLEKGASPVSNNDSGRGPLWWAAKNGQVTVVELLLTKGADIEVRDYVGRTALMEAAANGQPSVVELLLSKGAKIETKDYFSQTPLIKAAENEHTSVVELLLTKGANIEAKDEDKQTALINAAAHGHTGVVELLLIKGANIEAKDRLIQTALIKAAANGHSSAVELLLSKGANVEAKDNLNQTALSKAAAYGHSSVVELLLIKGASIEAKDNLNQTALRKAAANGHTSVVELLLTKGANIEAKDDMKQTALIKAAANGRTSVVELLLTKGANVEAEAYHRQTALIKAAAYGHSSVVELLLAKGANIEEKDYSSETALIKAAFRGHTSVVELLLTKGANIEAKDAFRQTALINAVAYEHASVVNLLLTKGANVKPKDKYDRTALAWAIEKQNSAIIKLLEDAS